MSCAEFRGHQHRCPLGWEGMWRVAKDRRRFRVEAVRLVLWTVSGSRCQFGCQLGVDIDGHRLRLHRTLRRPSE